MAKDVAIKTGYFQRDISLTGVQSIRGLNFKPTGLLLFGAIGGQAIGSIGLDINSSLRQCAYGPNASGTAGTVTFVSSHILRLVISNGNYADIATIALVDDGFDVTWTKTGSPTGTATIEYVAFKG